MTLRDKALVSGIGETRYVRAPGSGRTPIALQMEAALAAIADAGLTPKDIDGISVLPTFFGATPKRAHAYLYWESHEKGYLQAVREGDWKAVKLDTDKPLELYNLATDPAETQDVAKANPDVVKRLAAHMKTAADPWSPPKERSPFLKKK